MRRIVCLCLCFVLLLGWNIATADSLPVLIEQGLAAATDEELAEASALIKNEQRARMKTKIQLEPAECSIDFNLLPAAGAILHQQFSALTAEDIFFLHGRPAEWTCFHGSSSLYYWIGSLYRK